MLKQRLIHVLLMAALGGLSAAVVAAQRDAPGEAFHESGQLRKKEEKAVRNIDKYAVQLGKTERALTRLGRGEKDELRGRYESFSGELNKLDDALARAVASLDKMKADGVEYFSSWEKANASISDPLLREKAAKRRSGAIMRDIELAKSIDDIGLELQPFMSHLRDLKAFLGADLSAAKASEARERIQTCQTEARELKSRIAEAQTRLKQFLSEMPE